jgi:hypothetical protein
MTDTDLLAEINALRAELAAQQRTIPALPDEDDMRRITWRPWQQPPTPIAHIDLACHQCDHPGPQMLAFGLVGSEKPVIAYQANRCPSCQEMRVYRREPAPLGPPRVVLTEIAYHPPQTPPASTTEETNQ